MKHIGVKNFKDHRLKKFKNNPKAKSETSFCSTIELEFEGERFLFCDAPGFRDTRGVEMAFSNTVGIIKALENLSNLKTIIPVFFFSIDEISAGGGRGDDFIKNI